VSLHGLRIKHNPTAKRDANRYLFQARNAARVAFGHSQSSEQEPIHLNWTHSQKTLLVMLGAFALAILLIEAMYSRW
jgi:hypothetical protein